MRNRADENMEQMVGPSRTRATTLVQPRITPARGWWKELKAVLPSARARAMARRSLGVGLPSALQAVLRETNPRTVQILASMTATPLMAAADQRTRQMQTTRMTSWAMPMRVTDGRPRHAAARRVRQHVPGTLFRKWSPA